MIRDWLIEKNNGWAVGERGETHLIESEHCKFYIGPDYVAGYPSCDKNLQAADPEFFDKLEQRLLHLPTCTRCKMLITMDKISLERLFKESRDFGVIEPADNYVGLQRTLNSCYRTMGKPLPYPIVRIDP